MLIDLTYSTTLPSSIYSMIALINGVELDFEQSYFEHYTTGVYRHDGYIFNFDHFIREKCDENIADKWIGSGVCDNYEQVIDKYNDLLSNPHKKYVIGLSTIERVKQPAKGGWRWHKWGEYIGTQTPKHEYLYDDVHIDKVYYFQIYELA